MEKKKWSDLWLSYDRITELGGTRALIIEGFDAENRIIKSAAKELERGLKGLVGTELVGALSVLLAGGNFQRIICRKRRL